MLITSAMERSCTSLKLATEYVSVSPVSDMLSAVTATSLRENACSSSTTVWGEANSFILTVIVLNPINVTVIWSVPSGTSRLKRPPLSVTAYPDGVSLSDQAITFAPQRAFPSLSSTRPDNVTWPAHGTVYKSRRPNKDTRMHIRQSL